MHTLWKEKNLDNLIPQFILWRKKLEERPKLRVLGFNYIGTVSGKKFLLHHKIDQVPHGKMLKLPRNLFFWVQIIGSKFETKNFKYSLKVEDPEIDGTYFYKGYVKSLDDKKTDVYESSTAGLMISVEVLKKFSGDVFTMEIEIEDQKPKEDSNVDEEAKDE